MSGETRAFADDLHLCPDEDPHACALYFYTEAGDHMGYHYDTSYYTGARYTVLFGQGLSVNALQAAGVFQTIANDGVRIPPRIVAATGCSALAETIALTRQGVQSGFSTADVPVHPSGRFLYGSNRGHDSIVVFAIDEKTGRLTYVENRATQGSTPRGFGIDPSGSYLLAANQRSDSVVVFRIDKQTGRLTPTGHTIDVGAPVCVKFVERSNR